MQHAVLPHPLYSIRTIHSRILWHGIRVIECYYKYHVYLSIIECECKYAHRHTCTPTNQSSNSSCTPRLLYITLHRCNVYTRVYITSDPWRWHTSLCLQAEMDIMKKDMKMEIRYLCCIIVRQSYLFLVLSYIPCMPLLVY